MTFTVDWEFNKLTYANIGLLQLKASGLASDLQVLPKIILAGKCCVSESTALLA